jgi:hypothetical protein
MYEGLAAAGAKATVQEVPSRIQGKLTAAVSCGDGDQNLPALGCRRLLAPQSEDIVNAQLGAGSRQLCRHAPRSGAKVTRQCRSVDLLDLVGNERRSLPVRKVVEGCGHGLSFFLAQ